MHIATNGSDLHVSVPQSHLVNELSEDTTLLMFKIPQVDLDKQVDVASVSHFAQRVVVPFELLSVH